MQTLETSSAQQGGSVEPGNIAYPAQGLNSVRPHAPSSSALGTYTYNANGSMTQRAIEAATGKRQCLYWNPENRLECGGADPSYKGLAFVLEHIEYQIRELGAVSMKFYNMHVRNPWRCDDPAIAYPMYERCRELGVNVVQFHKGIPFGTENLELGRPNDLQAACRDFPDMTFILHHLAVPYVDETVAIAGRFPNMYLALSANLAMTPIAPRLVQEQLGLCLQRVGVDKLLWGSEAGLGGPPAPYIQAFLDLEMPEDLRVGYGYPQITRDDKRKILGENFARVMGVDIEAKKRELAP
jgi:uncharacterized protein